MVCILKGCVAPSWTQARELMASMTFKLELVLMDPTRIKASLIRKVVKILNRYHAYLTPNVSENKINCLELSKNKRRSKHSFSLGHQLNKMECRSHTIPLCSHQPEF